MLPALALARRDAQPDLGAPAQAASSPLPLPLRFRVMTRNVVLYELMSLDGFADDPGEGEWFGEADERLMGFLSDVIAGSGRGTAGPAHVREVGAPLAGSRRCSRSPTSSTQRRRSCSGPARSAHEWSGSHRVTEPAASLRHRPQGSADGGDIGIHGSLSLARALLAEHLVDELRLVVAPSLAGRGKRLFDDNAELQRFELLASDRSGGCLLLHYRRRRSTAG